MTIEQEIKKLNNLVENLRNSISTIDSKIDGVLGAPPLRDHFHNGFDVSPITFSDITRKKVWVKHTIPYPSMIQFSYTTGAWGGGSTSNAFSVPGVQATDGVSAVIRASTNLASIQKAIPTSGTITVTFSADPGASTTVDFIISRQSTSGYGVFFIAPFACTLTSFKEVHEVAGTSGSAVTLTLEKLTGTQAPDAGVAMLASTLSLKTTANTVQTATLTTTTANLNLAVGDRLCLKDSGNLVDVAGVTVLCELQIK